jgi:hypothetical protein
MSPQAEGDVAGRILRKCLIKPIKDLWLMESALSRKAERGALLLGVDFHNMQYTTDAGLSNSTECRTANISAASTHVTCTTKATSYHGDETMQNQP